MDSQLGSLRQALSSELSCRNGPKITDNGNANNKKKNPNTEDAAKVSFRGGLNFCPNCVQVMALKIIKVKIANDQVQLMIFVSKDFKTKVFQPPRVEL